MRRQEEREIERDKKINIELENKKLNNERASIAAAEAEKRRQYIATCKGFFTSEESCAKKYDRLIYNR